MKTKANHGYGLSLRAFKVEDWAMIALFLAGGVQVLVAVIAMNGVIHATKSVPLKVAFSTPADVRGNS